MLILDGMTDGLKKSQNFIYKLKAKNITAVNSVGN